MNEYILIGGGGHCRSIIDVLETAKIEIAGVVHSDDADLKDVFGYPALGHFSDIPMLSKKYNTAVMAIGQIKTAIARIKIFNILNACGFSLPNIISPRAYVSKYAKIGSGTIVMHSSTVNSNSEIKNNCIINTCSLIEHDCIISSHCHIAVGAIICGGVEIFDGSFIGAGSIVKNGVKVGYNAVIGCGSVVCHDVHDNAVVFGYY